MNLLESVWKWVLQNLPYDKADPNVVAALESMSPGDLLILYLNWKDRLIPADKRQVLRSAAFDQNATVHERASTISQIIDDVEHGRDLTKYLSRRVKTGFDLPQQQGKKNLKRLEHLDLLLNEWGIHHLHISTIVKSDGFVEHSDPLLFAMFRSQKAYFIDVLGHQDFANDRLIRIVLDTWPSEGLVSEVKGVRGSRQTPSSDERTKERAKLRSVAISTVVQIDQRVFVPGTSISTAGTTSKAGVRSGRIMRLLKQFEDDVKADPAPIIEFIGAVLIRTVPIHPSIRRASVRTT